MDGEDNSESAKRRRRRPGPKPWEPTPRQLRWFEEWTEQCLTIAEISRKNIPYVSVNAIAKDLAKVGEWLRQRSMDHIMAFRDRQTAQHEMIMRTAIGAWDDSVGETIETTETVGGKFDTTTTKTMTSSGNPAYLNVFMHAAKAIREIWGVNAPVKTEVNVRHTEEIEGLPMAQAFNSRAEAIEAAAQAMLNLSNSLRGNSAVVTTARSLPK